MDGSSTARSSTTRPACCTISVAYAATGISDNGSICGVLRNRDGVDQGFVRDGRGKLTFLPLVFNNPEGTESVYPNAINALGQVIGAATLVIEKKGQKFPEVFQHGFLWDPLAGMTDLGPFYPHSLNNAGELTATVGILTPQGPQTHAFVRYADGTWLDLNDIVDLPGCNGNNWISRAPAINDAGEILVVEEWCPQSLFIKFRTHVLVPLPECIGDISSDGAVNVDDLVAVILSWGVCPSAPCTADIAPPGGNGQVDVDDLVLVIMGWGACG
jgi:probable HAF family extracellular repeat protein